MKKLFCFLVVCAGCEQPELSPEEELADRRQAYHENWMAIQADRQENVDNVKRARMNVRLRERKRYLGY